MRISVRRRRFAGRLLGYATNPARRRVRTLAGREQHLDVGGLPLVLPPGHDLPYFIRRDPTYDTYAAGVLREVVGDARTLVIDVGANVGDTALRALSASDQIDVLAVEGDPEFIGYLHRNLDAFGARARIVEGFVGPLGTAASFVRHGSTGQVTTSSDAGTRVESWISPAELLETGADYERVVWKTDIDGFDIHLLVEHWQDIDRASDVIWFEFDPAATLGDRDDVGRLVAALAASGRRVQVYDNLGRQMQELPAGAAVEAGLGSLARWLVEQHQGHLAVPYADVWAFPRD